MPNPKAEEFLKTIQEEYKKFEKYLTKKEFFVLANQLIDFLKSAEANLTRKIDLKLQQALNDLAETTKKIAEENASSFSNMKRWASERVNELFIKYNISGKLAEVDDKLAELNAYQPPDPEEIALKAQKLTLEALKPLIPEKDTPQQIRDKLEDLNGENKLHIDSIWQLQEILDELKNRPIGGRVGGGFSAIALYSHIIPWTEATGTPNDVLLDFTIGHSPNPVDSLEVMVGGSPLFLTDDYTYTVATHTISFLVAPPTGSKIRYKCLI